MSKDNINLIKYLAVIYFSVILAYKLPHDSYSIIEYIIKPIRRDNTVIYLSGIIILILIFIGLKGILRLNRFVNKNRIIITFLVFIFVIPFMKWTIDFTRMGYHTLKNDGINSIDIKDSDITLNSTNDSTVININLKLVDYSRRHNKFNLRVYLPKTLSEYTGKEYYDLKNNYETDGSNYILNINEDLLLNTEYTNSHDYLFQSNWFYEDVRYELYDDNETVSIIKHGF